MNIARALVLSGMWVALALLFNAGIYFYQGPDKALQFLTGYVIELSLSVDNIFVFLLIFNYFQVPLAEQSKVLFWGVLGAQFMRLVFIVLGLALLAQFQWVIYVFGAFLMFTGVKLFIEKDKQMDFEGNSVLKGLKRFLPSLSKFWIVLIIVETTDLLFAVDSVPAVLAVTKDPFIVYTSNIFAILGLRSMYFALAGCMPLFHYLHYGLGAILVFVGFKMLAEHYVHVPLAATLGFIALALVVSISVSLVFSKKKMHV